MKHPKRLQGVYQWVSPHQRQSRFGGPIGRQPIETRKPLFWMVLERSDRAKELFFVNETEETLKYVATFTGGFITAESEALALQEASVVYRDVLPHEAVKVEEFDGIYDLDYVFQVSFELLSEMQGTLRIVPPSQKGQISGQELLWDDGSYGRHVVVERLNR